MSDDVRWMSFPRPRMQMNWYSITLALRPGGAFVRHNSQPTHSLHSNDWRLTHFSSPLRFPFSLPGRNWDEGREGREGRDKMWQTDKVWQSHIRITLGPIILICSPATEGTISGQPQRERCWWMASVPSVPSVPCYHSHCLRSLIRTQKIILHLLQKHCPATLRTPINLSGIRQVQKVKISRHAAYVLTSHSLHLELIAGADRRAFKLIDLQMLIRSVEINRKYPHWNPNVIR